MTDYYYYATAGGKKIWVRLDFVPPTSDSVTDAQGETVEEVLDHDANYPIRY